MPSDATYATIRDVTRSTLVVVLLGTDDEELLLVVVVDAPGGAV
jgi:hypothetical protein